MTITPASLRSANLGPHGSIVRRAITPPREGATFPPFLSSHENRCWPEPGRVHRGEPLMSCPAQVWSQTLPFQQFHVLFNPLFKVLFIFRSLYLCAIGLWPVFSFRRDLPPILSSIPKLLDSSKELHTGLVSDHTGLSPSVASRSRELGRHRARSILCKLQLGPRPDFKFELLPLHSPLLGQSLLVSFPPLIDMLKFSGYSYLIRGQIFRSWGFYGRAAPVRSKARVLLLRSESWRARH